ncbi:MAG: hypothetical protein ACHQVK_05195 [Candidatus Paceibacterales bacterium]
MTKPNYTGREAELLKKLDSPKKVQDYLNGLKFNFELQGETCYSPRVVIKHKSAHCMEGALLAAAALEFHGRPPLVMDLRSQANDFDHVVAVFKQFGCFGAISKTNHAVLRYREPIYKTLRELALSYFHEYFLNNGKKTLREYSAPVNLSRFDKMEWRTSSENLFAIPEYLDEIKHYKILSPSQIKNLRKADKIEILAGKMVEWKK